MSRTILTGLAVTMALASVATPADARSRKAKRAPAYPYERSYVQRENPDSAECIRARSLDAAGNYKAYPCWARAALSGNPRTR